MTQDEPEDEETVECPECGEPVDDSNSSVDGTRCSDCYWKSVDDPPGVCDDDR